MTQKQIDYTMKRLEEIRSIKIEELKISYKINSHRLSPNEKFNLIKEKKVKLRVTPLYDNSYAENFFDFSKFEWKDGFKDEYEEKREKLYSKYNEIRDQIMLGDSEEAIKLIETFKNFNTKE